MIGRRLLISALLTLIVGGCNLSDDEASRNNQVDQTNNASNNDTNNASNNGSNNASNNATNNGSNNATPVSVVFTKQLINGVDAETATIVASTIFELTATVETTNSTGCPNCPIQVVLENGDGLTCLSDELAGTSTKTITMQAPEFLGDMFIYYHVREEATCDAAIEKITQPTTDLFGKIPVVDGLSLIDVFPSPNAKNVAVDTTVLITASKPIDPTTVTASVLLFKGGTRVPATASVEGAKISLRPNSQLEEFQTEYSVVVTTGLKSVSGLTLGQESRLMFSTVTLAGGRKYAIRNAYHGDAYDLVGTNNGCVLASNTNEQDTWQAARFPQGGTYLHSSNQGVGFALNSSDGSEPCLLTQTVGSSAQNWNFTKSGAGFLMQTAFQGMSRALDANKDDTRNVKPAMADVSGESTQEWYFVPQ